jgi:hypothetical protein
MQGVAAAGLAVLVLLAGCGDGGLTVDGCGPPAPCVALQRDDTLDRLSVPEAGVADWDQLAIKASAPGTSFALNANATAADTDVGTAFTEVTGLGQAIVAGDYLEFCGDAGPFASITYTVIKSQGESTSVIGAFTFHDIAAC